MRLTEFELAEFNNNLALRMKTEKPYLTFIEQKNNFELGLGYLSDLKKYKNVELTFFLYPFSKTLNADSFTILPYQEYIEDINSGQRSTYQKIEEFSPTLFGLGLGFVIATFFIFLKPEDFFSIQSIVSIFGAYAIGKEIWQDLNDYLVKITKNWPIRWKDGEYYYSKQDFGTIQKFWREGRNERYKISMVLPTKMDFISQSNTKTVEISYNQEDLNLVEGDSTRVASINFPKKTSSNLTNNFLFTTKLTLVKKGFFINFATEYFQALKSGKIGSLDPQNNWQNNILLVKKVINIGQIKIYLEAKILKNVKIINYLNSTNLASKDDLEGDSESN